MTIHKIILIIVIFFVFLAVMYTNKKLKQKIKYDTEEFPPLVKLTKDLNNVLFDVQNECIDMLDNATNIKIFRKEGKWINDDNFNKYIDELRQDNNWVYGWTEDKGWLNYLIIANGELMPNIQEKFPHLYRTLYPYQKCFNIMGVSVLKPHRGLPVHNDPETTLSKGSLVYHFNVYCPNDYNGSGKSIITLGTGLGKKEIEQKSGNSLVFDSGFYHSVKNKNPHHRIILYSDFSIDRTNDHIIMEVKEYRDNRIVGILSRDVEFYNMRIHNEINGYGRIYFRGGDTPDHLIVFDKDVEVYDEKMLIRIVRE